MLVLPVKRVPQLPAASSAGHGLDDHRASNSIVQTASIVAEDHQDSDERDDRTDARDEAYEMHHPITQNDAAREIHRRPIDFDDSNAEPFLAQGLSRTGNEYPLIDGQRKRSGHEHQARKLILFQRCKIH